MKLTEAEYDALMRQRWRHNCGPCFALPPTETNKYGAIKTMVGDEKLDSKAEARRYSELLLMEKAGEIWNLKRQVRYPITVNGHKICTYCADFDYDTKDGHVTEDTKGCRTPVYRLKKKLMWACHGIEILETN